MKEFTQELTNIHRNLRDELLGNRKFTEARERLQEILDADKTNLYRAVNRHKIALVATGAFKDQPEIMQVRKNVLDEFDAMTVRYDMMRTYLTERGWTPETEFWTKGGNTLLINEAYEIESKS